MRMRRHRLVFTVIAALLAASTAVGAPKKKKKNADAGGKDTVILNDGTILKGTVLSEDPKKGVTIKLSNGKTQKVSAADVKLVDRAVAPSEPAAADDKEIEEPPEKDAPEPATKEEEPTPAAAKPTSEHQGVHFGAGIDLDATLSRSNAQNSLKLISPWIGAHGSLDAVVAPNIYFRGEFQLGTFSRKAQITVPLAVDTTGAAPVVTPQIIHNDIRVIDAGLRAMIGYDYTPTLTGRIGLNGGLSVTSNAAVQCQGDSRGKYGITYGGEIVPIAVRVLDSKALELGLSLEYVSVSVPRCDVPNVDGFVVPPNVVAQFSPSMITERIAVGTVGLTSTYMFW